MGKSAKLENFSLSILRIVAGFTFSLHGFQKMLGMFGGSRVPLLSLLSLAGVLELCGGILILVGLFTRPTALVLSGHMAVAYFRVHAPQGFWPVVNRGELAVLYCFLFLYFVFRGPGVLSLDRFVRRKTTAGRLI